MIKVDFLDSERDSPSRSRARDSVFNALQEEICTVIEYGGSTLDPGNNHQLYDAVKKIANSPYQFILEYIGSNNPGEWNLRHVTRIVDLNLNSKVHQAVIFRLQILERNSENEPFVSTRNAQIRLSFQRKSGIWATDSRSIDFRFENTIVGFDSTDFKYLDTGWGGREFSISVNSDENLSITSPGHRYKKHSQVVLSRFQFVKRVGP